MGLVQIDLAFDCHTGNNLQCISYCHPSTGHNYLTFNNIDCVKKAFQGKVVIVKNFGDKNVLMWKSSALNNQELTISVMYMI